MEAKREFINFVNKDIDWEIRLKDTDDYTKYPPLEYKDIDFIFPVEHEKRKQFQESSSIQESSSRYLLFTNLRDLNKKEFGLNSNFFLMLPSSVKLLAYFLCLGDSRLIAIRCHCLRR
jgi:hypothetical protein